MSTSRSSRRPSCDRPAKRLGITVRSRSPPPSPSAVRGRLSHRLPAARRSRARAGSPALRRLLAPLASAGTSGIPGAPPSARASLPQHTSRGSTRGDDPGAQGITAARTVPQGFGLSSLIAEGGDGE
ncbi:hypothetical protein PAHAL_7G075100 [Panicum hallii]|uniref:Uncharacterized protein n=1 Tax=Panicum hallii TaxID=206008 RepID=A0A2T8IBA1_9POAL|nr:hypothetical protein PAHAL_7G075100 [Panicum hallii]